MSGGIEQFAIGEEMDRLAAIMAEHNLKLVITFTLWNTRWFGKVHGMQPRPWNVTAEHKDLDFMLSHLRKAAEAAIARGISPPEMDHEPG